jgi:hypothetical protein
MSTRATEPPTPLNLEQIVREFLAIAMVHPEKPPKTQRAQRDNQMLIIGFNQAQEALRTLIAAHGYSKATKAIADVRSYDQQRPLEVGGLKAWVAS